METAARCCTRGVPSGTVTNTSIEKEHEQEDSGARTDAQHGDG